MTEPQPQAEPCNSPTALSRFRVVIQHTGPQAALMRTSLVNDFLAGAGLDARSDWVLSFPTRRFYVDPALTGVTAARLRR